MAQRNTKYVFVCTLSVFIALLIGSLPTLAQPASVFWELTSTTAVSEIQGNIVGLEERFSFSETDPTVNLQVKDYQSGTGQRLNLGTTPWPNESVENPGRYVQFAVQPAAGYKLVISSLQLDIGAGGTSSMRATLYYSKDSTFSTRTQLGGVYSLPNSAWYDPSPSFLLSDSVASGETFYFRIYVWYNSSNASTSKYLYLRNVRISGLTYQEGTVTPPTVITVGVQSTTATSATIVGAVSWDGGAEVIERGFCWNTTGLPTISDNKVSCGRGVGEYSATLVGLTKGVQYFVRAYAVNDVGVAYGEELSFVPYDPLLAFPGAEGFGKYTRGGRGGVVIEVTNLNDSGEGSLRAAIQASGPRTVVFRVSGTIELQSPLKIQYPYITIAGQTAPGDGICLKNYPLEIAANNVIVRYLRVRLGDLSGTESDAITARGVRNVILDHCSASWSVDETMSLYSCDSITVQWCIISESLYNSNHIKGAHGYGGIWGGPNATFHHNLLAHHSSRNPRFAGYGVTDFRNNVIYNWGFNSAYGGEDSAKVNVVANYYKPGPATLSSVLYRIVGPSTRLPDPLDISGYGRWYVAQNIVDGYPTVNDDNLLGVQVAAGVAIRDQIVVPTEFPAVSIQQQTALEAYHSVLENAGATKPKRDVIDQRIVDEVRYGVATYSGITYCNDKSLDPSIPRGIIDSQTDVGGWPTLATAEPPLDTDHDGMPDEWELRNGLNPNNPDDRNDVDENGYTALEKYLNSDELLNGIQSSTTSAQDFVLFNNYPNPFNSSTRIQFSVQVRQHVTLRIYNTLGQVVGELFSGIVEPGTIYSCDFSSTTVSTGVYYAVLSGTSKREVKKMLVLR